MSRVKDPTRTPREHECGGGSSDPPSTDLAPLPYQRTKRVQVLFIERVDFYRPCRLALSLRGLEQHRDFREPPIVDQCPEPVQAETSPSDVLVAIDAAAERLLRVVEVKRLQPLEADHLAELGERAAIPLV